MRYTKAHISLHWITAILILFMATTGLLFSYELVGSRIMIAHQMAGQALIIVLLIRIVTRISSPPVALAPSALPSEPAWQRRVANIVHVALYLTMMAYVATGYVAASAETDAALLLPVDLAFARSDLGEELLYLHYNLKWVLGALLALHIGAALKHRYWDRDTVLSRMTFHQTKG